MLPCKVRIKPIRIAKGKKSISGIWEDGYHYAQSMITEKGVKAVCVCPKGFLVYVDPKDVQIDMSCLDEDEPSGIEFTPDW